MTGPAAPAIPLADVADRWLAALADVTGSAAIGRLDGATLLGERAALRGLRVGGRVAAGGGCVLLRARGGWLALNLAREDDRALLPAWLETPLDPDDPDAVAAAVAGRDAAALLARGREMGLAVASDREPRRPADRRLASAPPAPPATRPARVVDLSALWAGPLATRLLGLAGADVVRVESRSRPDAMRDGDPALFARLGRGKRTHPVDLAAPAGREALRALVADADIVVEAARPRALLQLGIDADAIVAATPGLVWVTITGHGAAGEEAGWVGFGDDCGVAGGLAAALAAETGSPGFVGDAIADPLTGLHAARLAWDAWRARTGGRFGVAMSGVVALAIEQARLADRPGFAAALHRWGAAAGRPFPAADRPAPAPAATALPC